MSADNPHHVKHPDLDEVIDSGTNAAANAIIDAIDRLTAAVLATAGRRDPEPDRCPIMLKSGNASIRCVRRNGHGDDCE